MCLVQSPNLDTFQIDQNWKKKEKENLSSPPPPPPPGGVLLGIFGRGVPPGSPNPDPIIPKHAIFHTHFRPAYGL